MGARRLPSGFLVLLIVAGLVSPVLHFAPRAAAASDLSGRSIAVDAGHGGTDPGASGFNLQEKTVNLDVALRLRDLLVADRATVVMTRTTDASVSLSERTTLANNAGANVFVSIHSNACGSCGGYGTETYYHSSLSSTSQSANLARQIQGELIEHLGTRDRGVKQADFYVLRNTNMPAALAELAFIDHSGDNAILASPAKRQEAARALLHAIQKYFGVPVHDPSGGGGGGGTDTSPPSITITAPLANAWVRGSVPVEATVSDPSGVKFVRMNVDGGSWLWDSTPPHQWTWATTGYSDGAHTILVEAEDNAANRGSKSLVSRVDNTPPSISLSGPAENAWVRATVSLGAAATDAASGVDGSSVAYRVDGGGWRSGSGASSSWSWDTTGVADGSHTLEFRARDQVGNERVVSRVLRVDNTPPSVTLTNPKRGVFLAGDAASGPLPTGETVATLDVTVKSDASDPSPGSGMSRVEFYVDGTLRATDAFAPYSWRWAAGDEGFGDHLVSVKAFDVAGNSATTGLKVKTIPSSPKGAQESLP